MELVTDKHSHYQFCMRSGDYCEQVKKNGINDYPLIDWCQQYLKKDELFIDIGADIGTYSLILSKYCKQVHAFEENDEMRIGLSLTVTKNNIDHIKIHKHVLLDSFENIGFLKIQGDIKEIIEGVKETLKKNSYPPFIFNHQPHDMIKALGYTVHNINGCPHWLLASDHPSFAKRTRVASSQYQLALQKVETVNDQTRLALLNVIAIEAYYNQDYDIGKQACEELIFSSLPRETRLAALSNAFFYMTPLPYLSKMSLNVPMIKYRVPNNPSIIQYGENYLCNIRASNYVYDPNFRFLEDPIHRSDHHLITLDDKMMITKTMVLKDVTNNVYHDSFVQGVDDLRLIDETQFLCSHGNLNTHKTIEQCLGTYDQDGNITKLIALKGPTPYRHEKNWLPFIKDELLYIIYMIHPFTLYKVDRVSGEMEKIKEINLTNNNLDTFRGSAPCIPYENGWLATAHQVTNMQYFHRFIWFNDDFTTIKYSEPFYFQHRGIEFNLGMCHSPKGLKLAYSVNDNHPQLITIDYDVVKEYLHL